MMKYLPVMLLVACSSPGGGGGQGTFGTQDAVTSDGVNFGDNGSTTDDSSVEPDVIGCENDQACPSETPHCYLSACVECSQDAHCPNGGRCADGECLDATCEPGTSHCNSTTMLTCNINGTGYDTFPCPNDCVDGKCAGCSPGDRKCNGTTVIECKEDATEYVAVEICQGGQICGDGECITCIPNNKRCADTGQAEFCGEDGEWHPGDDCNSQGLACLQGNCVSPCIRDPKGKSNSGCDYWAVDMDNHYDAQNGPYAVIVSNLSAQVANVKVTRKDSAGVTPALVMTRDVQPGGLEVLQLPNRNMGAPGIFWTAYRVESNVPIIAYQFNPLSNVDVFSNDASLLLPANTFGREYIAVSRFQILGGGPNGTSLPYRGEVNVVASQQTTNVTITPSTRCQAGTDMQTMVAGQSYEYALEPYQVLNIKSDQDLGDLTGTVIMADRPVAAYGGHEAAVSSTVCCADHLEHQLFPVATWGTEYVATKMKPRGVEPDYWKFIAATDGTVITITPSSVSGPITLNRGQFKEITTQADFTITATHPIMVSQTMASSSEVVNPPAYSDCTNGETCAPNYSCYLIGDGIFDLTSICAPPICFGQNDTSCPGGHVCNCFDTGDCRCAAVGDPTLVLVPPQKQFRKDYVFLTPDKYATDYINIVAPAAATVKLDDVDVAPGSFVTIAGSEWKVARLSVADGVHKVDASLPVGVIVYGYDRDVSYGYAAGLNLSDE